MTAQERTNLRIRRAFAVAAYWADHQAGCYTASEDTRYRIGEITGQLGDELTTAPEEVRDLLSPIECDRAEGDV